MAEDPPRDLPKLTRRIVDAATDITEVSTERPEFLHAVLCQVGLPRSRMEGRTFERTSGTTSMLLQAGSVNVGLRSWKEFPLPYGTKPRLVLYHLCSESVRTQSRQVDVGGSIRGFLDRIGVRLGGRAFTDFKRQMLALSCCTMTLAYWSDGRIRQTNADPIDSFDAWFPQDPDQKTFWSDEIVLGEKFFATLCEHAVPLDPRAIHALQHSSLALDMYTWLAHRLCRVRKPEGVKLSWRNLKDQFGQEYAVSKDFKKKFRSALIKVKSVYPDARIEETAGGIVLRSSPPPVPKTNVIVRLPES